MSDMIWKVSVCVLIGGVIAGGIGYLTNNSTVSFFAGMLLGGIGAMGGLIWAGA